MANDVTTNRAAQKWTAGEQVKRVLWALVTPLFRFSPRVLWGWRRMLLRLLLNLLLLLRMLMLHLP